MNISSETLNTLKNFSQINPSLTVKPGNEIVTMSPSKTIIAKMITDEVFDKPFCIYELNKFLGMVSMLEEPDFDFGDVNVDIKSKTGSVKYTYADESMIVAPVTNNIAMEDVVTTFELNRTELTTLIRAAGVLQSDYISIRAEDGQLKVGTSDPKNSTAHAFSIDIKSDVDRDFEIHVSTENIVKILAAEYTVSVSSKVIQFKNDTHTYWIVAGSVK